MDRRNLPFNALRAFEAAARHASVSGAAKELAVTHSAISHQIKRLENELETKLFVRTNRGLNITRDGEALLPVLSDSFDQLTATLENIRGNGRQAAIQVTSTPSFASKWLIPRLADWYAKKDVSRIHLLPSLDLLDFRSNKVDFAIRCGIPPWKDLDHQLLMPIHLVPVCSPDYASKHQLPGQASDVLKHDLIHADIGDHGLGEEWCDWLKGCNVSCPDNLHGLSFQDPALAMQAAADGLGLAIGYRELIDRDLHAGRLISAFDQSVKHQFSYYLVYQKSIEKSEMLIAFRDWIQSQLLTC
jgi:LysR family glycine cleavage system transcriptional activator